MAQHTVRRGPFTGRGRNLTTARKDLDKQIDAWLRVAEEPPVIVCWRGVTMLGHRTPDGWDSGKIEGSDFRVTCSRGPVSREEVKGSLAFTLAQQLWDGEEETPEVLAPFPEQAKEFLSWVRCHKRYRAVMSALRSAGVIEDSTRYLVDQVLCGAMTLDQAIAHARSKGLVETAA